jgi:hypothetical protein
LFAGHGVGETGIERRESLDEALRVPGGQACCALRGRMQSGAARVQDFGACVEPAQGQVAWRVVVPFDAALFAVDAQAQAVALAGGDLRGGEYAGDLAFEAEQVVAIVVEPAAGDDAGMVVDQLLGA